MDRYGEIEVEVDLDGEIGGDVDLDSEIEGEVQESSGGGTTNYEQLTNLPHINGEKVIGNKNGNTYGLINSDDQLAFQEIDNYFQAVFGN